VKKAIVGVGAATKEQVESMVKILLPGCSFKNDHEADAIAIALCHGNNFGLGNRNKKDCIMIGWLKGKVRRILKDAMILDVNNVGYHLQCSNNTIAAIGVIDAEVELFVETYVREDQITLFGFATESEKEWFTILTKVNGVGPKMVIAILSALKPEDLRIAIISKDKAAFKTVSGVGPKLAERIVTELKDKAGKVAGDSGNIVEFANIKGSGEASIDAQNSGNNNNINDAALALEKLGFSRSSAYGVVARLASENPELLVEDLIKEGLKELSSASA
jgi:Holliday junction DNA helicase RuvA